MKELHEVRQWLASEQFWKNVGTGVGVVGTMGAVVGSVLNPEVGIFRWLAAGLGIGTAAAQYRMPLLRIGRHRQGVGALSR